MLIIIRGVPLLFYPESTRQRGVPCIANGTSSFGSAAWNAGYYDFWSLAYW